MIEHVRLLAAGGFALLVLGVPAIVAPAPLLVWNASASTPKGLYGVVPGRMPGPGDWVVLRTPGPVRMLAAQRHYVPLNVPLVKRVSAASGQVVCAAGSILTVDGRVAAHRRDRDPSGRVLPRWQGCQLLAAGELLVLGSAPDSFDGRYFGPVGRGDIIGKAVPLWLR